MRGTVEENPAEMMFEDSLDLFARKIGIIVALEAGGKKTIKEAFAEIKALYKNLKKTRKALGLKEKDDEQVSGGVRSTPEEPV